MNKEVSIRRQIASLYNKREDDFPSLRAYNDYLEEVEDIIINLVEGVDVQATKDKVAKYQEENAEQIVASRARKAEEQAAALRQENGFPEIKVSNGEQVALQAAPSGQYAPALLPGGLYMQPRPAGSGPQPVPVGGPFNNDSVPEDEEARRVRIERAARAGGWTADIVRKRALQEALGSLWVN
ncbi:hypothetical protein O6H91_03G105600 [Diphasiastrum complanatum]|uniref:Uncharacterized protein n=1 Tax=Diphasiastrum complanatum TaxID=34168 RepID=A0ACC2EA20_DIPCM|nr:hypothetical protein O6H91_03G105600 [Diphasiastrum complanatum]